MRQQPQAVGAGEAVELVPPGAGQAGVAGAAGDEQAALARAGDEVAEQLGEAAAFVVGVGAGEGVGRVVELRQGALEVVPDHEHVVLPEQLDGPAALLGGGELLELRPGEVGAEHLHHAVGAGELLEAEEARAVAEQAAARPPVCGLGGERGLAHAAHGMQHDAAMRAEPALQLVKLPRPAVEAVLRRRWKAAGFLGQLRRAAEPATAPGILGIGTADEPGEQRGVVGVRAGSVKSTQSSSFNFGGNFSALELDRDEPVAFGIELVMLLDLPLHPFRFQRGLRADDDREAAVLDAGFALRLQFAGEHSHLSSHTRRPCFSTSKRASASTRTESL